MSTTRFSGRHTPNWIPLSRWRRHSLHKLNCCQSQSYITTDSQSASPSWFQAPIWDPRPIFSPLSRFDYFLDSFRFVDVGRPLWREDGSLLFRFCRASPAQPFSDLSPTGLVSILYYLYFWDSPNLEGQVPIFIFSRNRVACLINLRIITCYIYRSYMYNTYTVSLLVQARTADYALPRVVQVATQF
jgi:hypothetical protein